MTAKRILTMQDISCVGQCSITVALPIISACGIETVILPSAILSAHTGGFKGYTFRDLTDDIPAIIDHWKEDNITFDCIYTGYLGNISQVDHILNIKKLLLNNDGILIVDPAMADNGKLYSGFNQDFVNRMKFLCHEADIILPNITEAALLTGCDYVENAHSKSYIMSLLTSLTNIGAKKIILKGITFKENEIGIAVYDSATSKINYYFTPKIGHGSPGTGDCYASAFTGALMNGNDIYSSAKLATDFVLECIKQTINDKKHWYGVNFEKAIPMLINELKR